MADNLRWPGDVVDLESKDVGGPTTELLIKLSVLEDPKEIEERAKARLKWETFPSLQVITAGATSFSKWMTAGITAIGGGSAVLVWIGGFWNSSDRALQIAYVAFIGILLSVCSLAIAIVVRADVSARALASAAEYEARSAIAVAFISATPRIAPTVRYWVKRKGAEDEPVPVEKFEVVDGSLITITKTDRLNADEIAMLWSNA